jgi:hypothetical protein
MANVRKLGIRPTRVSGGGTITYRRTRVLTNNTLAIALNDCVKFAATGDIVACASGTDENILMASVSGGVSFVNTSSIRVEAKALPAATLYTSSGVNPDNASYCYIVDNAIMVEFEANVANVAIALTDLNLNYPTVLTASSTVTGLSNHEINATGRAQATATLPWRVREFIFRADNDVDLIDVKVLAMINAGQGEPVTSAYVGT